MSRDTADYVREGQFSVHGFIGFLLE